MALTKSLSFSRGRKRILISRNSCTLEEFSADFESFSSIKRRFRQDDEDRDEVLRRNSSSSIEALPQDILIKVICGVDHDDLKQLIKVSKTICDSTVIAKKSHFEFTTPSKTKVFLNSMDFEECEAPNAPKQVRRRNRPRISEKSLGDVSVALFANDEEEEEEQRLARRSLFM